MGRGRAQTRHDKVRVRNNFREKVFNTWGRARLYSDPAWAEYVEDYVKKKADCCSYCRCAWCTQETKRNWKPSIEESTEGTLS